MLSISSLIHKNRNMSKHLKFPTHLIAIIFLILLRMKRGKQKRTALQNHLLDVHMKISARNTWFLNALSAVVSSKFETFLFKHYQNDHPVLMKFKKL